MSQNRLPPPESQACLFQLRPSTQKGGTLIAEEVTDWATHERRLSDPDGYRLPLAPDAGRGCCTYTITASACCARNPASRWPRLCVSCACPVRRSGRFCLC